MRATHGPRAPLRLSARSIARRAGLAASTAAARLADLEALGALRRVEDADRRIVAVQRYVRGQPAGSRLAFTAPGYRLDRKRLKAVAARAKAATPEGAVLDALERGSLTAAQLVERTGLSRWTVRRSLEHLAEAGQVAQRHAWRWEACEADGTDEVVDRTEEDYAKQDEFLRWLAAQRVR